MATLRKKGNAYFIDYRVDGRRRRKAVGKSKKMAELALKDFEVKLARKELGFDQKDSTLHKLLFDFQAYCKTNVALSTQKRYRAILNNFKRFLKTDYSHLEKISHFTPKIFEDYKGFRKGDGAENRTINAEMVVLRMMLRLAIQWGYSKENPTDGVSKLKITKKVSPEFLTDDQCRVLLDKADDWFRAILFTFLNTGMRKSELENLCWDNVDFKRRKIRIIEKDGWSPKTNEREIPINDVLCDVLQKQRNKIKNSKYVFPDEKGKKIFQNRLRKKLMSLTKKCGFPEITKIHALRHTFASHLVMKGVDLATVKKLMGHSDIDTTMIYSHLTEKHVDDAVEKLNF
ncbi:MAG: tyrosine-type recombinase/integrase [Candidatus Omnitrophica bacterium]|nr:tyrosine-type recombinase/integrase [Candidatus Omnitrophota bacterium]